ncbi:protein decapping 5 isoform X1 [Setaria viridis]|uniref:protein decapping 5 isoform X1 n=1 Tax=Setaria viridis TaxID=4556 RepID=UPI0014934C53|nr:protein decapping 5-like isoform X1 [Setaria viridis]
MAAEAPPSAAPSSSSSAPAPRPPAAAGSGSGGGAAASPESYIGSLISLTSKSEIRYEGVLYNINTEESSIGLRNVRSFGTEGRKKDGMQIPASDKLYEYILFRGSDIKDLQVKSSPPPPAPPQAASLHNDPAIIQSHYSQPASTSSSLPSAGGTVLPDLSSQAAQYGLQRPGFQSNLPLYQPGNAPWGSSVAPQAGSASTLSVPSMYWQGYYGPSSGLPPHLQQPPFLQPTPGLSVPQNLQYPGLNPSLPSGMQKLSELQPSLMPPVTSQGPSSGILPATTAPASATLLAPESSKPLLPNMGSLFTPPVTSLGATFPFPSQPTSIAETSAALQNLTSFGSNKASALPGSTLACQSVSQSVSSTVAPSSSSQVEMPVPLLAPSGQLLQNTASMLPSSHSLQTPLQMANKEAKPVEPKAKAAEPLLPDPLLPDPPSRGLPENKEPILPLPKQTPQKYNGSGSHNHHNFRGRGRGRGSAFSQSVTAFTEEFDFTAMNEKFNKDEVWGHLGKKSQSRDKDGEIGGDVFDEDLEVEETENPELAVKVQPVYVKDDFFDSLSSGTFGRGGGPNGRGRFSERRRVDTETFGEFPRHRQPYRGGARGYRGGGRSRGGYYGGRGYGNMGPGGYGNMGTGGPGNSYPQRGGSYGRD